MPKSRLDFWRPKLIGNVERDHRKWAAIREAGWRVMVIWECEMNQKKLSKLEYEIRAVAINRRASLVKTISTNLHGT